MTLTGRRKGAGLYPDTREQPSPLLVKRLLLKSSHWVTDLKVNEVSYTQHASSLDRMRAPTLMGGWLSAYIIISAKNPSELSQEPERTGPSLCSLLRASCSCWRAVCHGQQGRDAARPSGVREGHGGVWRLLSDTGEEAATPWGPAEVCALRQTGNSPRLPVWCHIHRHRRVLDTSLMLRRESAMGAGVCPDLFCCAGLARTSLDHPVSTSPKTYPGRLQ